jgi:hypothetical protein
MKRSTQRHDPVATQVNGSNNRVWNSHACKMALFDEKLYNMDTATYNTSLYFSKMKKEEQELIRSVNGYKRDRRLNVFKPVFDVGRGF